MNSIVPPHHLNNLCFSLCREHLALPTSCRSAFGSIKASNVFASSNTALDRETFGCSLRPRETMINNMVYNSGSNFTADLHLALPLHLACSLWPCSYLSIHFHFGFQIKPFIMPFIICFIMCSHLSGLKLDLQEVVCPNFQVCPNFRKCF